jgi:CheY-like chemotaxis protein
MNDPLNLLLVEDSEDDAYFFQRTVRKSELNCTIRHERDGSRAVEFLNEVIAGSCGLPDLIFLDLKMPRMNGFEVLEWIRNRCFSNPMPVIVLSGSFEVQDQTRARELGASDYMVKPIRVEGLRRSIERVIAITAGSISELKDHGMSC